MAINKGAKKTVNLVFWMKEEGRKEGRKEGGVSK